MTKLTYNQNNLTHTVEGSKDDVLMKLMDIVTEDMTIIIDDLKVVRSTPAASKKIATTSTSTITPSNTSSRYTYSRANYRKLKSIVVKDFANGMSRKDLYEKYNDIGVSTIQSWLRDAGFGQYTKSKKIPKTKSSSSSPKIVKESQIKPSVSSKDSAEVLRNLFMKSM